MRDYLTVVLGSVVVAAGFNVFLIPHSILSGGVSGVSMMTGYLTGFNIGIVYFLLNLPILIAGWYKIGHRFIFLSIFSVILVTLAMQFIPTNTVTTDPLLASVFGGVLVGIGTGINLRAGGSTGGFDIVGSILTRKRDFPLGSMIFFLNSIVVLISGYMTSWEIALYSMLSIYVTGRIIDSIHTRHVKMTAFIITKEKDRLLEKLVKLPRGITVIRAEGGYSHQNQDVLMTVTTRYELVHLKKMILEVDPKAFVNIVETVDIVGSFRK